LVLTTACVACMGPDNEPEKRPTASVNDVMTDVITPASNTLWSVEDPQSDAEWQVLSAAAIALVDASEAIRQGGSGPNDMEWAANPAWQAFLNTLAGAASDARDAAAAKDLDSLLNANDVLYPPCEECHLQFHPGVSEQEFN
jgi:cytochrome c556